MLRGVVVTANDVAAAARARCRRRVPFLWNLAAVGALPELARGVLTDDRGQFTIHVPATASVRLAFTKARYATRTADISPRELTVQRSEIRVRMSLAGAISGQVLDRSGTGVMMAVVTLQRVGAAAADAPMTTRTNDLGEFRFGGLAEGTYAIAVATASVFASVIPAADYAAMVRCRHRARAGRQRQPRRRGREHQLTIDMPSELD